MEYPLVTVLLPVYNGEKYIVEAVQSILNQDYPNFELLLINDGSKDGTDDLIRRDLLSDQRVRYHSRENKGLIDTLNEGISMAKGDYIARMDADDISHRDRLSKQVAFLNKHSDVAVVGTAYNYVSEDNKLIGTRTPPCNSRVIKAIFLYGTPLAHPTVMINKKLASKDLYYDKAFIHGEDYELWLRLSLKYKLANIKDICLEYRVLEQSVSRQHAALQKQSVVKAQLKHLYSNITSDKLEEHAKVLLGFNKSSVLTKLGSFLALIKHRKEKFSLSIAFLYLLKRMVSSS